MWLIIPIVLLIVALALVGWGITKGNTIVRIVVTVVAVALASYIGFGFGSAWEKVRTMDTYGYWIGWYSSQLRYLAEHQQINELTNDIILFDSKFGPHQYDLKVLQDTMYEILKLGPYRTNDDATTLSSTTNAIAVLSHDIVSF